MSKCGWEPPLPGVGSWGHWGPEPTSSPLWGAVGPVGIVIGGQHVAVYRTLLGGPRGPWQQVSGCAGFLFSCTALTYLPASLCLSVTCIPLRSLPHARGQDECSWHAGRGGRQPRGPGLEALQSGLPAGGNALAETSQMKGGGRSLGRLGSWEWSVRQDGGSRG